MTLANSERLSYRLMDENDAHLLFELDQDPAVMKYINGGTPNTMDDICNTFIPRLKAFTNAEQGWGLWQVNITETEQFIGWILVRPMGFFNNERDDSDLELGWRFKQCTWGKGYASEAANHIAHTLTSNPTTLSFSATALPDNLASIAIMKKLGMSFIKEYIHKDPLGDCKAVLYRKNLR
ncbi:GNAT family N-acetyltransferase [Pseudoalteromonas sp. JBTF-M23]|uniref:GNAT family N-acetyltransferase n=1 Tax=Pseudoalteromonas caenipelagi TaxID=2726988 RepID=A0A849VDR2_9GAMM|nr:GNAT family N-acetyltransferase [Pseudoalteromonas caenipelagi]NOU51532.1 GNAT family N-acetyltransferase [Pseudoalteromonas caenipelagi]